MNECNEPFDQSKIPFRIDAQMSVYEETDHPDYNIHHEKGWCYNEKEDHESCKRLKGHRGKHYCNNCGESWKNTDQPKVKRRTKKELLKLENESIHEMGLDLFKSHDMAMVIMDIPDIEYRLKKIIKDVNFNGTKKSKERVLEQILKEIKIYEIKEAQWKRKMIKTARELLR